MFEVTLLVWLIVAAQQMSHSVATEQMTDFLGDVLGVVAGALDGLCHQQHVRRVVPRHSPLILQVTDKDQVAAPVDLRIGATPR